jgi:hypothetical protein
VRAGEGGKHGRGCILVEDSPEGDDSEFRALDLGLARDRYLSSASLNELRAKGLVALKLRLRILIIMMSVVSTVMHTEKE